MMRTRLYHALSLGLFAAAPLAAQQLPPVRALGPITKVSPVSYTHLTLPTIYSV